MLTLNRAQLTIECTEHNRRAAGMDFDLLVLDNGSKPAELEKMYAEINVGNTTWVTSENNMGVGAGFNRLIWWATLHEYDLIVIIGNDIKNSEGWLTELVKYHKAIPDSGIIALNWGCGAFPIERKEINGLPVDVSEKVYGVWALPNHLIEKVGYFNEDYFPYGMEDSDYNARVLLSGYTNFYIPGIQSEHVGEDGNQDTEYRKMKWESLRKNSLIYDANHEKYLHHKYYYVGYGNTYEPNLNPAEL